MAAVAGFAALGVWSIAAAAPASAPPAPPPADSDAPAAPVKRDVSRVVSCRDVEVTGSHIGRKRVCHTKQEWDDLESQTQETILQNTIIGSGVIRPR
jgi:hypothetical protein